MTAQQLIADIKEKIGCPFDKDVIDHIDKWIKLEKENYALIFRLQAEVQRLQKENEALRKPITQGAKVEFGERPVTVELIKKGGASDSSPQQGQA